MNIPLWRDMSIVLLAIEAFVLALVPLAILYFANRGLWRLRTSLRPVFTVIRGRVEQIQVATARLAGFLVAPIIAIYALASRVRTVVLKVGGLPRGGIRR
jgi:hypothetical protein